jgi:hypothetical protein
MFPQFLWINQWKKVMAEGFFEEIWGFEEPARFSGNSATY